MYSCIYNSLVQYASPPTRNIQDRIMHYHDVPLGWKIDKHYLSAREIRVDFIFWVNFFISFLLSLRAYTSLAVIATY